jgi:hypothetical protein
LHGLVPIAAMQPTLLYNIKPMNHLTHQDIVEGFDTWFEQILANIDGAVSRLVMGDFSCFDLTVS